MSSVQPDWFAKALRRLIESSKWSPQQWHVLFDYPDTDEARADTALRFERWMNNQELPRPEELSTILMHLRHRARRKGDTDLRKALRYFRDVIARQRKGVAISPFSLHAINAMLDVHGDALLIAAQSKKEEGDTVLILLTGRGLREFLDSVQELVAA